MYEEISFDRKPIRIVNRRRNSDFLLTNTTVIKEAYVRGLSDGLNVRYNNNRNPPPLCPVR